MEIILNTFKILFFILLFYCVFYKIYNYILIKKCNCEKECKEIEKEIQQRKFAERINIIIIVLLIILAIYIYIAILAGLFILETFLIILLDETLNKILNAYGDVFPIIIYLIVLSVQIKFLYTDININRFIKGKNKQ